MISDQAKQLMQEDRLVIELEAVVVGTRTFKALDRDVAKVTVSGNPGGSMGQGVECLPYALFELDAEMSVFRDLGVLAEPGRFRFRADLKPINSSGGYVVHLLEVMK